MAVVYFSSELQKLTGEISTRSEELIFKNIVSDLVARYSELNEAELMSMAVAIDGEIIQDPFLEKVDTESELHFLHRISGG